MQGEAGVAGGGVNFGRSAMSFAIIRGGNGRRHEVDFGGDPVRLDVSAGRRFATLAVPREELITALGAALGSRPTNATRPRPHLVRTEAQDDR
jgi:hypothetical protein